MSCRALALLTKRSRSAAAFIAAATFAACAAVALPARADEATSLANVLLAEQLADVATTQQLLHTGTCDPQPLVYGNGKFRTVQEYCIVGTEADPLARPFVGSAVANVGAALAVNGLIRLVSRHYAFASLKILKMAVVIYPTVIIGNINSTAKASKYGAAATTLSMRLRI